MIWSSDKFKTLGDQFEPTRQPKELNVMIVQFN